MIKIACVENHTGFRSFLVRYLEGLPEDYRVYQYTNGKDFTDIFPHENFTPAIVLMDVRMPEMDGYETTAWLKEHYPSIPVLIFSDIYGPDVIVSLVRSGAKGHISKNLFMENNRLVNAISKIIDGGEYYDDPKMYSFVKERLALPKESIKDGIDALTPEELKVVRYLIHEGTHVEKANHLNIAPETYKTRLSKIFKKLGVKSSFGLYKKAFSLGLIENY